MMLISMKILSILTVFLVTATVSAKDLGVHGRTYNIVEPDALMEVQAAAQAVDWANVISKEAIAKKILSYKPKDLKKLPTAQRNRTRHIDMTSTLASDIRDAENHVVYPKGYKFNPLDYVTLPTVLVFINAADPQQIKWYQQSPYLKNSNTILMITDGSFHDTAKILNQHVYYVSNEIVDRFQLSVVPSIIYQRGHVMEVIEKSPL